MLVKYLYNYKKKRLLKFILSFFKTIIMRSLLYIIAVILVIGWLIGFIGYGAGGLIHILLVIAVIAILFNIIGGSRNPL